jgi:hypothetical protein
LNRGAVNKKEQRGVKSGIADTGRHLRCKYRPANGRVGGGGGGEWNERRGGWNGMRGGGRGGWGGHLVRVLVEPERARVCKADARAVLADHVHHRRRVRAVGAGALGDGLANLHLEKSASLALRRAPWSAVVESELKGGYLKALGLGFERRHSGGEVARKAGLPCD